MSTTMENDIAQAANTARDLLGQLGPLAWALHVMRLPAGAFAVCVDREPEKYVEIRTGEDEPEREERKQRVVSALRGLRGLRHKDASDLFGSVGYRDTINRSMVVYAVAVLEEFLDQAARPIWEGRVAEPVVCPRGCRRDREWPADTLNKISFLRRDMDLDLRSVGRLYVNAGWLVLVRNAVIHNDGIAPPDVAEDAGQYELDPRWAITKDEKGSDILVWDEREPVSRSRLAGKRFSIAIDHFVLPRVLDAQAFVAAAADILLNAGCGARRPSSAPPG